MDPFSIATGVLAIAQVGLSLSTRILDLIETVQDAPKQMSEIAVRISELSRRLKSLRVVLRDGHGFIQGHLLKRLRSSTRRIESIHRRLLPLVNDGEQSKRKRVAWIITKKQSQKLLDRIRKEEITLYRYVDNIMLSAMLSTVKRVDRMDSGIKESLEKLRAPRMSGNPAPPQEVEQHQHVATRNTGTTDQVNEAPHHFSNPKDDTKAQVKVDTVEDCDQQSTGRFCEDKPQIFAMNTTMISDLLNKLLTHANIQDGRVQIVCGPVRITQTSSRLRNPGEQQAKRRRRFRPMRCGQNHRSEEYKEHPSKLQEDESQVEQETAETEPVEDSAVHLIDPNGIDHMLPFEKVNTWDDMEEYLQSAAFGGRISKTDVMEGRYDLITTDQVVVEPRHWKRSIRPGSVVRMSMWGYEPARFRL